MQSMPAGAPKGYPVVCEAMLRAGGFIYYKSSPGDCGTPPQVSGIQSGQIVGLSGQAASAGIGVIGAAGIISGPATAGIGTAVSLAAAGITEIFTHHAQAVKNEQSTICAVAGYFNAAKKQVDTACYTGQITADQAVTYLIQIANQAKTGLASIQKKCNAACVYQGIAQAFINFARTYYDSLSPLTGPQLQAPGAPPSGWGTPPGGVTVAPGNPAPPQTTRSTFASTYLPAVPNTAPPLIANANLPGSNAPDYLNMGYNQQSGQSGQRADVPPSNTNWVAIGAIASVIALVIVLYRG
jgi:hypothetical protein